METTISRGELKAACLERLDAAAVEHPAGHQGRLAARYVLRTTAGDRVELMFEKGPKSPPNLWMTESHASNLLDQAVDYRRSPADPANASAGDNGNKVYGRHSALKPMRQLEAADLVCIRIADVSELDWIIDRLRAG